MKPGQIFITQDGSIEVVTYVIQYEVGSIYGRTKMNRSQLSIRIWNSWLNENKNDVTVLG